MENERKCEICERSLGGKRPHAMTCGPTCRQTRSRNQRDETEGAAIIERRGTPTGRSNDLAWRVAGRTCRRKRQIEVDALLVRMRAEFAAKMLEMYGSGSVTPGTVTLPDGVSGGAE